MSRGVASRLKLIAISLVYALTIHIAHAGFLYEVWAYFGFDFSPMSVPEVSMTIVLVALGSSLIPLMLKRPSSLIILVLYLIVYIPTVVLTLGLPGDAIARYGVSLVMLAAAFTLVSFVTRLSCQPYPGARPPGKRFELVMLALWLILAVILVGKYYSIMRLVSLAELYTQREAGASQSLFMGYAQTYFSNVISPCLLALGLVKSRKWLAFLGVLGCLIMYMINAQKLSLALPVAIYGLHWVMNSRHAFLRSSFFAVAVTSVAVAVTLWIYSLGGLLAGLPADLFVFRTLGLPGLAHSQYLDLFSSQGFTFWSHVKGINLLVAPPASYLTDPSWPNLGHMVGDRVYGNYAMNYNAHLFAWDGVAAAGALGVIVMGAITAVWLRVFDLVSRSVDAHFVILVTLPIAMSISNGSLFTVLLSFGGIFWLAIFLLGNTFRKLTSKYLRGAQVV